MRSRLLARLLWHRDKWDRLVLAADCVRDARSVLDVGGRGSELALLLPHARVTSANVEPPADVLFDAGRPLPFAGGSFEMVTSCDVIEHVPPSDRQAHVAELVRVAERRVVLCCPLGTDHHRAAERELASWAAGIGARLDFLDEHLRYGIPSETELRQLFDAAAPRASVELRFHGDVDAANRVLRDGVRARWKRDPSALARYVRAAYLDSRRPALEDSSRAVTNRVYAIVDVA